MAYKGEDEEEFLVTNLDDGEKYESNAKYFPVFK
jgi:hypothetical protein